MSELVPFAKVIPGEWFDRPKLAAPPQFLISHWSAGWGDASRVYRALVSRGLSCHFATSPDGTLHQQADVEARCAHAGSLGNVGIGNELCNPGLPGSKAPPRPMEATEIHGRKMHAVPFSAAQYDANYALAEYLADRFDWPRVVPNTSRVLTPAEIRRFKGALEHLHISSRKIDAGMLATRDLVRRGWKPVDV